MNGELIVKLRDLPSTAEPQLDENGQLTNVTWRQNQNKMKNTKT